MSDPPVVKRDLVPWESSGFDPHLPAPPDWRPGAPIGYVRAEIPEFTIPSYEGERYRRLVPATLDLQERAGLAVNGLTGPTDPLADHELYIYVFLRANPPMMLHCPDDWCTAKHTESLPLMRIVSGSSLNEEVDRRWMEVALRQVGDDGLVYLPLDGRPWALIGLEKLAANYGTADRQLISPMYCGRLLAALTLYATRDPEPLWTSTAERLVDALATLAIHRRDYAFFAPAMSLAKRGVDAEATDSGYSGLEARNVILSLVKLHRQTGYEPALDLAGKLVHHVLDVCKGIGEDGSFGSTVSAQPDSDQRSAHFHQHSSLLQAILEFAMVTGNQQLLELAHRGYQFGRSKGNLTLGYFPEMIDSPRMEHSELCEVADMIVLGLKLTEAGCGDYWSVGVLG